jgi:hypothetical protein
MARFSEEDRATIWGMREAGVPVKRIAMHLDRTSTVLEARLGNARKAVPQSGTSGRVDNCPEATCRSAHFPHRPTTNVDHDRVMAALICSGSQLDPVTRLDGSYDVDHVVRSLAFEVASERCKEGGPRVAQAAQRGDCHAFSAPCPTLSATDEPDVFLIEPGVRQSGEKATFRRRLDGRVASALARVPNPHPDGHRQPRLTGLRIWSNEWTARIQSTLLHAP